MIIHGAPSLSARQDILTSEVPKLGAEAASKAIGEWGRPKSSITHLIFHTTSGAYRPPGADFQVSKLLGLQASVKRIMLCQQGCYAGETLLRTAKDIVENNPNARVLVVCSEITLTSFHSPSQTDMDSLLVQGTAGDGAAALVVGADPDLSVEKPFFEIVSASEIVVPDSEDVIQGPLREMGLVIRISKSTPALISDNITKCLMEAIAPLGMPDEDWNSFWVTHPSGRAVLDSIEDKLGLGPEKLARTRNVMSEHGNMASASVLFILDEMRRRSSEEGKPTYGEGREWGIIVWHGSGITISAIVLRSLPTGPIP